MGFWSGFEGLTGHRPGAFKGFSLKDILDKDMWERRERLNQGRRFEETGVPETTNWYRGRGRPEMMGPRVGAAGVSSGAQLGVGRDRPFPITPRSQPSSTALMKQNQMAVAAARARQAQTQALPSNVAPPPQPLSGNPYKRSWAPGMSEIGGHNVPTMYDPYMFGQRQDQMGAEQFNPLNRRIQQSKRDQRGLPIEAQYGKGIGDAIVGLGGIAGNMEERMFGPLGHRTGALRDTGAHILENPTSLLSDARDYWMPADKKTVIKRSANPAEADTSTTTITEKMLGPSGHRMGALKDTAKDIWGDVSKPNFLSDPEFWRRFW